ncbi:hypothetical protein [Lichenibacterium minor]|nr:hypothetical protein [Lichenibacterium minor]
MIRDTRRAIATSRCLIARAAREREEMRSTIEQTRRLIAAARSKLAEDGG